MGSLSWRERESGSTHMHACICTHTLSLSSTQWTRLSFGLWYIIYTFYTRCECERVYIYAHGLYVATGMCCCWLYMLCWHACMPPNTHHTTHTMPACHASSWGTLLPTTTTTTTRKETARALIHGPKLGLVRKWL